MLFFIANNNFKLKKKKCDLKTELPLLYKTLDIQHLVCTTYHLYNTSFVQNLYIQQLICTTLTFTTSHLYNTLDTQHLDIQHFKFNVQPLIWELLYHTFPFKHFYLKIEG